MRRVWVTVGYLALILLVLGLMSLASWPVDMDPAPAQTAEAAPSPTTSPVHTGPTTIVIDGLDLDDIDDLWVGIPVEGMPE